MKKLQLLMLSIIALNAQNMLGEASFMDSIVNYVKEAIAGTTPEQKTSALQAEATQISQQKNAFEDKLKALKQIPGAEKLLNFFQPVLEKLSNKEEEVQTTLTSLNPTTEGLQKLQTKAQNLMAQKGALTTQIEQANQAPTSDMWSNLFLTAQKAALQWVNSALEAIKPIIETIKQKLTASGLDTLGLSNIK